MDDAQTNKHKNGGAAADDVKRAWLLHHGIKSLLKCDEAEVVQGIARYVVSQYQSLRIGAEFVERRRDTMIPAVAAFLGAATRFLEVCEPEQRDGAIWIARLANERRAIEKIIRLSPELDWTELRLRRPPELAAIRALPRGLFPLRRRIFRLVRLLLRRKYEFFGVLRVVELIGYYARFLEIFARGRYRLAVVSSHSNPHGIAFNLAARKYGVPTVLPAHGMPVRPVARLFYDLAVLHCEAAKQIYLADGCSINQVFVYGRRQDYAPMPDTLPKSLTVGVFLCKDVNEPTLRRVIENLLKNSRVAQILVRPHPKNIFLEFETWLAEFADARLAPSANESARADLAGCDVVFGGNSSVLIEAVTAGRPGVYVPNLDHGSIDLHCFVADNLIFQAEPEFDFDKILDFYRRAEWFPVLRLYAAIDADESDVERQVISAIRQTANFKVNSE